MIRALRLLTVLTVVCWPALASLRIHTSAGVPVRWFANDLPVRFVVQAAGSDDVPDTSDDLAVRRAFADWSLVSGADIAIEEDTDPAERARTDWAADDNRLVIFDEDGDTSLFPAGSGIVAVTPLQYVVSSGRIVDADIVLNGKDTDFGTNGGGASFDVRAIVAHEVGHLLGLAHSALGHATMTPFVTAGGVQPRTLTPDDRAGLASIYPDAGVTSATIRGRVRRQTGAAVSGAQVHARAADGRVLAATFSDATGDYALNGLEPGSYDVVATAVDGPLIPAQLVNPTGLPPFQTDFQPTERRVAVGQGEVVAPDLIVGADATLGVLGPPLAWPVHQADSRTVKLGLKGWVQPGLVEVVGAGEAIEVDGVAFLFPNQLRFSVDVEDDAPPGGYDLRLTSSAGAVTLLPGFLEVMPRTPELDDVEPGCGLAVGGAPLTVTGDDLTHAVEVRVGSAAATDLAVFDDETVVVDLPPVELGLLDVTVMTSGGEEANLGAAFTAAAGVAPTPGSLFPGAGASAGGTTAVLTGVGFEPGDVAYVDGFPMPTTFVDGARLDVVLPPLPPGAYDVTVVDAACASVAGTLLDGWTATPGPDPVITGITPDEVAHLGGDAVFVQGDGYLAGAQVELFADLATGLGGQPVPTTLIDPQTLRLDLPSLPLGSASVLVRLPDGRVASADGELDVRALLAHKGRLDGSVDAPGSTDIVWVDGLAGTQLSLTLKRLGKSDLVPFLDVRDELGQVLVSSDPDHPAFDATVAKSSPSRASVRKLLLPGTERYAIHVGGLDGTVGDYRLSVREKLPPEAKTLALPKNAAPTAGPDALSLPLLAKPGSTLSGKLVARDDLQLVFVSLVDPDGVVLLDDSIDGLSGPQHLMDAVTLDTGGRWIRFKKLPLDGFGEFELTLGAAPGTSGPITGKLAIKTAKGKVQIQE